MISVPANMPSDAERFLSEGGKRKELAYWECVKRQWRSGCLRGVGEPDRDIVPWCDRFNALPGVCTLQSCAGHVREGAIEAAHLWIWMSEPVARNFDGDVYVLLRQRPPIDWISKHFLHDGKEIAAITFFGNERDLFGRSVELIYNFMRRVTAGET
jgi:hypothetical protein